MAQGFGEGVCYVINDLLNKELIRRDFRFDAPIIKENGQDIYGGDANYAEEVYEEIDAELKEEHIMKYENKENDEIPESESINNTDNIAEKEENNLKIVEATVSPEEWMQELKRIGNSLVYGQEDLATFEVD